MAAATIVFETQPCRRCAGSGRYSYCTMYGDTCFAWQGRRTVYSKRAEQAIATFKAERMRRCGVAVEALTPGMKFLTTAGKWATVASVTATGGSRYLDKASGEWRDFVTVTSTKQAYAYHPGTRVIVQNAAVWPALVAFARTLPGVVDVREPVSHEVRP